MKPRIGPPPVRPGNPCARPHARPVASKNQLAQRSRTCHRMLPTSVGDKCRRQAPPDRTARRPCHPDRSARGSAHITRLDRQQSSPQARPHRGRAAKPRSGEPATRNHLHRWVRPRCPDRPPQASLSAQTPHRNRPPELSDEQFSRRESLRPSQILGSKKSRLASGLSRRRLVAGDSRLLIRRR